MLVKNKNSKDYTSHVKIVYNLIKNKFGYSARISDIWNLLSTGFNIKEFEIFEPKQYQNGNFEAYLIDMFIKWQKGEDIDFSDIAQAVLTVGDFTGSEKLMFSDNNLEECLWSIYLYLSDFSIEF